MDIAELKVNLADLPRRMRELPIDPQRKVPVPFFAEWIDGKAEFRLIDGRKWIRAVRERLCWVCGQRLGAHLAFVIGPMCGVNRTTSEPPCHLECARWSARNCPFIVKPHMIRRGHDELIEMGAKSMGGNSIKRNPGVMLLWVTKSYQVFSPAPGERLIEVGEPEAIEFYSQGRTATRDEIDESVRTGLPFLTAEASKQEGGMEQLAKQVKDFKKLLPPRPCGEVMSVRS
jgi:hypothetical protein